MPGCGHRHPRVISELLKDKPMKIPALPLGVVLLIMLPGAYADSKPDQGSDPCFNVTIQNQPVNRSKVRQNCDHNINRTVQAGAQNQAHTVQSGQVNDNKVRQYQYDRAGYLDRIRGK
jgi:hypothetical protein